MICCKECYKDSEIDADKTNDSELLESILELYVPDSELPITYPEEEKRTLEEQLL